MPMPSRAALEKSQGRTLRPVLAPGLRLLISGINPGLYSAWASHHFARPGNRFWPLLYGSGLTPRLYQPTEDRRLLALGIGLTNLVNRATAMADEVRAEELRAGARLLERRVARYRPRTVAVLGLGAYRTAFRRPGATVGRQAEHLSGAALWVLPSPSGANRGYSIEQMVALWRELRDALPR